MTGSYADGEGLRMVWLALWAGRKAILSVRLRSGLPFGFTPALPPVRAKNARSGPVLRQSGTHLSDDEAVAKMGHPGSVVVVERDHASEVCLVVLRETTRGGELIGIAKCSEDAIPPGDVTIVELVNVELVMD